MWPRISPKACRAATYPIKPLSLHTRQQQEGSSAAGPGGAEAAELPPMNTLTIYFLKALITGEKRRKYPRYELAADSFTDIPMDAVKQVHVPSYENLSLKLVYAFFE